MDIYIKGLIFLSCLLHIHGQSTPPSLEYKPTRPFYAPKPVWYPEPITRTPSTSQGTTPPETTTAKPDLQKGNVSKVVDNRQHGSIILDYKPTRPFYAPNPVHYPSPHPFFVKSSIVTAPLDDKSIPDTSTTKPSTDSTTNKPPSSVPVKGSLDDAIQQLTKLVDGIPDEFLKQNVSLPTPGTSASTLIESLDHFSKSPLEYVPSRPPFAPNPVVYPQPIVRDNSTNTKSPLEYEPSRPPFAPNPIGYPRPPGEQNISNSILTTIAPVTVSLENQPGTEKDQTTKSPLEYVPSRPPFAPNPVVYPQPIVRDNSTITKSPLEYEPSRPPFVPNPVGYPRPSDEQNTANSIVTTTATGTEKNQITKSPLEYVPSRPSFAPNPVVYPQPRPQDASNVPEELRPTTLAQSSTKLSSNLLYVSTPISLEYKPSRPPYAPKPVQYPQPHGTSPSVVNTQSTYFPLEYKPSRSPSAPKPDLYPQPTNRQNATNTVAPVSNSDPTTFTPNHLGNSTNFVQQASNLSSLENIPTRPSFAPNAEPVTATVVPPATQVLEQTSTKVSLENQTTRPPFAPQPIAPGNSHLETRPPIVQTIAPHSVQSSEEDDSSSFEEENSSSASKEHKPSSFLKHPLYSQFNNMGKDASNFPSSQLFKPVSTAQPIFFQPPAADEDGASKDIETSDSTEIQTNTPSHQAHVADSTLKVDVKTQAHTDPDLTSTNISDISPEFTTIKNTIRSLHRNPLILLYKENKDSTQTVTFDHILINPFIEYMNQNAGDDRRPGRVEETTHLGNELSSE